jgi:integrase/recombinase XerD
METMLIKFEAYLLTEKRVSHNTFVAYQRDVRQFSFFLNTQHATDVMHATREQIKSFLHYLSGHGLAARSLSRKISSLKTLYNYLHTYHGLENHGEDLIFPKLERRLPRYLREDEVEKLFDVATRDTNPVGLRNKAMLYLLYVSGMRVSELVNVRVSQVQFESSLVTVTGKGGKGRVIPIPHPIAILLKEYVHQGLNDFMLKWDTKRKNDYLFPVQYGGKIKPMSRQAFWGILKNLWKKTGIEREISPHQLRHSLATHLLKNGIDLRSLQLILGHENLTTVQIYTHVETGYLRNVYDKKHPRS